MKNPNLFIVGEPKSGTTALHNALNQHPDIAMAPRKELNFFCTDLLRDAEKAGMKTGWSDLKNKEEFLKQFTDKEADIVGETTCIYLYSKEAAKNIHKFNPSAKIIILLREPVDFLYSLHGQLTATISEDIKNFEKAISSEKERVENKTIPKGAWFPSIIQYSRWVKYLEQVKRYLDIFEKKQVKVIIYEDFRKDNLKVYKEILKFLGVDTKFKPNFKKANTYKTIRNPAMASLENAYGLHKFVRKVLPASTTKHISKAYKKLAFKKEVRPTINNKLKNKLMKKFKPEVVKISNLLNRNLVKKWGYDKIK